MLECLRYKKHDAGTLKGFADLYDPSTGIEFYGCTCHTSQGKSWVNLPSKEYMENGERKFSSVIRFREKEKYQIWIQQAKDAIRDFLEKPQPQPEPVNEEIPF